MTRIEALRSTLDRLSLDPSAAEDREYLVSMLRRLGYSELEIQAFMNESAEPEDDGVRIIEVEYTGALAHTMKDYQLVAPADDEMFAIEAEDEGNALGLDDELLDLDLDEFGIANFSDEDIADSGWDDDWGDDEEGGAQFDDIGGEHTDTDVDDFANVDDDEFADAAAVDFGGDDSLDDSLFDEAAGEEMPTDGNLLTFESDEPTPVLDETEAVASDDTLEFGEEDMMAMAERGELEDQELTFEEGADDLVFEEDEGTFSESDLRPTFEPGGPEEVLAEVDEDGPFKYGDYTLYTKEVEFSPERKQRIYFFAKNEPQSGEPCGLPAGYEIKENAQTGLPFLRRVKDAESVSESGSKKNVKVRVIRGQSAEEVEALMAAEGRKVLRTIPLHKHLVEED